MNGFRTGPIERVTTPWNYRFDLRFDKGFSVGQVPFNLFLYVQNLLNRQNVLNVYWRTGNARDDGKADIFQTDIQEFPGEISRLYDLVNLAHRQHYHITWGGDLFDRPREIRFGLQVGLGG